MYYTFTAICIASCGMLGQCNVENNYIISYTKEECINNAELLLMIKGKDGNWKVICKEHLITVSK